MMRGGRGGGGRGRGGEGMTMTMMMVKITMGVKNHRRSMAHVGGVKSVGGCKVKGSVVVVITYRQDTTACDVNAYT